MKIFRLDGEIAIVTGGAGHYGKPICHALAEAGAKVIIASRDIAKCKEFQMALADQGLDAEAMRLDLGEQKSIDALTEEVKQKFGRIDILVKNAVSREWFRDLAQIKRTDWENSQRVNSTGLVLLTQSVIKIMRQQRSRNIINIGSIQGAVGPNFPVYGDTGMTSPLNYTYDKWAMVGFTKWIANY